MIEPKTKKLLLAAVLIAVGAGPCLAADEMVQPHAPGIESPGYVWNEREQEKLLALSALGNPVRGAISFDVCAGCHGFEAQGDEEGYYPRLAGQHASVLIKQMTDVRAGRRDSPTDYPFLNNHVISVQEIADIAAYLASLPVTPDNGEGPGTDLAHGEDLYRNDCKNCHGPDGMGDAEDFYPRVSGQHYEYLLREARNIRDGRRRNANPDMVDAIKGYTNDDLVALSDYISRLPIDNGEAASATTDTGVDQ